MLFRTTRWLGAVALCLLAVSPASATTTTLATPPNTKPVYGEPLSFTATVTLGEDDVGTLVGGIVELLAGDNVIGSELLAGDEAAPTATFTIHPLFGAGSLPVGLNAIKARFRGDLSPPGLSDSSSNVVAINVLPVDTTTTISAPDRALLGTPFEVTAKVVPVAPSEALAEGTATFFDGSKTLGTAPVSEGAASFTVAGLKFGKHALHVRFDGIPGFKKSASTRVPLQVDFTKGDELVLNTGTAGSQSKPSAAWNPITGGALVVWMENSLAGRSTLMGQLIDDQGAPVGDNFTIAFSKASRPIDNPVVVGSANGSYYVGYEVVDASGRAVLYREVSGDGKPAGASQPMAPRKGDTGALAMTPTGGVKGGFVVAWQASAGAATNDGDGSGIVVQFFDGADDVIQTPFVVNTTTAGDQTSPAIYPVISGQKVNFVVAWAGPDKTGGQTIFFQVIDKSGAKIGPEGKVGPAMLSTPKPVLMSGLNSQVIVAWDQKSKVAANGQDTLFAVFNKAGKRVGPARRPDITNKADQVSPTMTPLTKKRMAIAWSSPDADGQGIFVQFYSPTAGRVQKPALVNRTTAGDQIDPFIAAVGKPAPGVTGAKTFFVVWTSKDTDGTGENIRFQAFNTP